jgi:hypothetical protein
VAWFEAAARRRREAMADVMWDEAGGRQGLTLVHYSAQRKRFLWDRWRF